MPEAWSGAGLVLWSKWLLFGPVRLTEQVNYHAIDGVITAAHLEMIALCVGIAQLAVVLWNKRWPRAASAFLAAVFWLTVAHVLWLSDPSAPGSAAYITLAAQNLGLLLLLACPIRFAV